MLNLKTLVLGLAAAGALASAANAGTTTYALTDIGTFAGYESFDTTQTYTGDGFLGMYQTSFAHLLGLEGTDYSRTVAQVGIGALDGQTINSAILSFDLLSSFSQGSTITVTGFGGDGALGFVWDAPVATYSTASGVVGGAHVTIDITNILAAAAAAHEDFLDLHLDSDSGGNWTYTSSDYDVGSADSAQVRLTVDSTGGGVPEPAVWAMMLVGFGGLGALARRRRALVAA